MRARVLVLGIVLLVGCIDDVDDPPADEVASTELSMAERFLFQNLVGTGGDAEASHAVSADGQTILACSHGGFTQPSPLWVSEDAGGSFRRLTPEPSPPVGGDCDVVIDTDGSWYMIFDSLTSVTVTGTSDKGQTWRFAYVTGALVGNIDRPWLEDAGDALYLTYSDLMSAEPIVLLFSKSTDQGRTWSPPVVVTLPPSPDETNCWIGRMVVRDAGRTILIPMNCWAQTDAGGEPRPIYLVQSTDSGASWRLGTPVALGVGVPTLSDAPDGTLWLTYLESDADERRIVARHRSVEGEFSSPVVVATLDAGAFDWPWIDARDDGSATVAWMNRTQTDAGVGLQPMVARVTKEDPRPAFVGRLVESWVGETTFEFFMVKHDSEGTAFVVYPLGGPGCKESPPGTGTASTRNDLCVHVARETRDSQG